jgi:hypothetical protein
VTLIRVVIGVVIAAIVAVTLLPLLVLLDLVGGGDAWGLCPEGISSCRTSYFDGPELLAGLVVIVFILLFVLRLALHARRAVDRAKESAVYDGSMGRGERLGKR